MPAPWKLRIVHWPRDLSIRQNMTTLSWQAVRELVAMGEISVEGDDVGEVSTEAFTNQLDAGTSKQKEKTSASLCWADTIRSS